MESEAALRLEEELKVSVKVENVSSGAGSNGVGSKHLEVELPERKSSETRSDILGDPPTLRKSSREGELTSNRKSHERKVHDSEALRKAKETEALRKAKEQEREAVKKENDERVNEILIWMFVVSRNFWVTTQHIMYLTSSTFRYIINTICVNTFNKNTFKICIGEIRE